MIDVQSYYREIVISIDMFDVQTYFREAVISICMGV